MNKTKIKVTTNAVEVFKPINVKIEFTIDSKEQLEYLRQEFTDGVFAPHGDFYTDYSHIAYDVMKSLKKIWENG